jgi:hypothetical protein
LIGDRYRERYLRNVVIGAEDDTCRLDKSKTNAFILRGLFSTIAVDKFVDKA